MLFRKLENMSEDEALRRTLAALEYFDFVGTTEMFDESLIFFEEFVG